MSETLIFPLWRRDCFTACKKYKLNIIKNILETKNYERKFNTDK